MEESGKEYIHEALTKRNIAHTFYSLETSNQYLRSQIKAYEIADQDKIYIPEIWTEDNPLCPVHEEALFEIPCIKKYKDRKVEFTGYFCDKCNKILMRSSSVAELEDNCALNGVPVIETESFVKKRPKKQLIKMREIKSDYIVENGKREIYTYSHAADCFKLTEEDTVVVSDSIYCSLEGHKTEEVLVLIWVNQKKGGRKSYIFVVGYCSQCQKYYMDIDDYNVIYSLGRPEVTIISDVNDADYQITSGEVFNLERNHLNNIESGITGEIKEIHESTDYVNPYAVGDYDDGNLSFAKSLSANKYGKRLEELENYIPKPYSYRVDISADGATETYYIGASDVILKDGKKVISANSDLGYELINYQTIKIHKDGKEYGKEDDEILAWMKQVSVYIKKVQDEVRLCSNAKEEYSRFFNELSESDDNIKATMQVAALDDGRIDENMLALSIGLASTGVYGLARAVNSEQWYRNIILHDSMYSCDKLLEYVYPELAKQNSWKLPVWYYIANSDYKSSLAESKAPHSYNDIVSEDSIKRNRTAIAGRTAMEIWTQEKTNVFKAIRLLGFLPEDKIDVEQYQQILETIFKENANILSSSNTSDRSSLKRMIRIYDFLLYRQKKTP